MVKKHLIALFVNTGTVETPEWTRIKKSTELTLALNPETEEVDYIADESPTTELTKYAPSIEQPLKMLENEPDFRFVFDKFFNLSTGDDAKAQYLVAFMFDKTGTGETAKYKAWSGDCVISIDEMNALESSITFTLAFGGTVKKGYITATGTAPDYVPTFTEGAIPTGQMAANLKATTASK